MLRIIRQQQQPYLINSKNPQWIQENAFLEYFSVVLCDFQYFVEVLYFYSAVYFECFGKDQS